MKLKEFIQTFVYPNTMIRLQYKIAGGHEQTDFGSPMMEWQIAKGKYADRNVIGITDILYFEYPEAVNIVTNIY